MSFKELCDLVHRRFRFILNEDNVSAIYAEFVGPTVLLTFILGEDLSPDELTKVKTRYLRTIGNTDVIKVNVFNATNNWKADNAKYVVWYRGGTYFA